MRTLIENLVQFEEDFNSGTKKSVGWGPDGYLRPVQFLDHLTVITNKQGKIELVSQLMLEG